eukprot:TRINITY_DN9574_c0_g1_i7.p1 TRINITY_DN9574_c0_g1~~TRINITY_DN9574_c0_g1_i7.p1  ORF type:complete len:473 (+),score=-24.89 TRINITY_DN9574_c0_g1_i7:191-1420(+)
MGNERFPPSLWALSSLEELETDLRGGQGALAMSRDESETLARALRWNKPGAWEQAEEHANEPRLAQLQRLTSLTLTGKHWAMVPPPSLRHLPRLTRLHMPRASASLRVGAPGDGGVQECGLRLLTALQDLDICAPDVEDWGAFGQRSTEGNEGVIGASSKLLLRPGIRSLILRGSGSRFPILPWASPSLLQLKLTNVLVGGPKPSQQDCLFPKLELLHLDYLCAPVSLGALPSLTHWVDSSRQTLTPIEPCPNLEFLHVHSPCPDRPMPTLPRLSTLILDYQYADSLALTSLSSFSALRVLRISNFRFSESWFSALTCPPRLKTLEIWSSPFAALPPVFENFSRVRCLRIMHCKNLTSLPCYLSTFSCLQELTVRGCVGKPHLPGCDGKPYLPPSVADHLKKVKLVTFH